MNAHEATRWLNVAAKDLGNASFLFENRWPRPLELICFLCQQCVEKALKAYLVFQDEVPSRTHDVAFLCEKCVEYSDTFAPWVNACQQLISYAVNVRYPLNVEIEEE